MLCIRFLSHAHAARCSECRQYRSCDARDDLHDPLQRFLLRHNSLSFLVVVRLVVVRIRVGITATGIVTALVGAAALLRARTTLLGSVLLGA